MRPIALYIFFFFCCNLQAQTSASLEQKLKTAPSNDEKAKLYLQHAQSLNYNNLSEVQNTANKAIALSKNDFQTQVDALQLIGNCNIIKGNYQESKKIFQKIELLYKNKLPHNQTGLIKTYGSLGVVASEQNKYHEAIHYYLKGLQIAEKIKDKKLLIILHNNIGVIYRDTKQIEKAIISFQKSVQLQQETNDNNAGITFTNLATIAIGKQQFAKAEKHLLQAKPFLTNLKDNRAWGEWHNNYGYLNFLQNNFSAAEIHLNEALQQFEAIEDQFGSTDTYLLLANLHNAKNHDDKAILYAKQALELGKKLDVLDHKQKANELLSSLYEKKGNTTLAFQYYKNYSVQKDSIINEENAKKLADAQWNYAFQKQQTEHQNTIKKASTQKWMIILVAFLLLISLLSYYLWKSKKQVKQQLSLEKELLEYEQKALHLQMNPHFVFNCLAAISSYVVQNKTEDAVKYLAMFSKLMRFTLESSKESLITIDKEIESITQYLNLENLRLNKIFSFSIEKSFEIEDDMALPPMLLQPLVENAIMHGILPMKQKGNIKIVFYTNNNQLFIEVEDDGIGIENSLKNKSDKPLHRSMAIEIVKKRLSMITKTQDSKASITFEQQKHGTIVKMILPVQYKK